MPGPSQLAYYTPYIECGAGPQGSGKRPGRGAGRWVRVRPGCGMRVGPARCAGPAGGRVGLCEQGAAPACHRRNSSAPPRRADRPRATPCQHRRRPPPQQRAKRLAQEAAGPVRRCESGRRAAHGSEPCEPAVAHASYRRNRAALGLSAEWRRAVPCRKHGAKACA